MAAAIASFSKQKQRPAPAKNRNSGEPVSFHLEFVLKKNFVLPEGSDSVSVLRSPFLGNEGKSPSKENITGTKMEFWATKFNSSSSDNQWNDRLLIITEKRIFIAIEKAVQVPKKGDEKQQAQQSSVNSIDELEKSSCKDNMEIVDSIPMEEILSVTLDVDGLPGTWSYDKMDAIRREYSNFQEVKENLKEIENNLREFRTESRPPRGLDLKRELLSGSDKPRDFGEPILRILTKPGRFNHGEPYYFILHEQDCPCVDAEGQTTPLRTRDDAEALTSRLASLAARRRTEHARENRFDSMQKNLRRVWDSVAFNLLVLVLIASNFAFSVMQLENKDPDMQPFYENVDFTYTIIFAVGVFSPRPTHASRSSTQGFAPARQRAQFKAGSYEPKCPSGVSQRKDMARLDGRVFLLLAAVEEGGAEGGRVFPSLVTVGWRGGRVVLQLFCTRLLALRERSAPFDHATSSHQLFLAPIVS